MGKKNEPVDPKVRLAIASWPDDVPRGAVTSFCAENGISRKTFYVLRARARDEGQAAVLEPKSRRPATSPTKIDEHVKQEALQVRQVLKGSGYDHGPMSVHDKMISMGLQAPSVASLARIFREKNVARREPDKKPRSAFRRFVYPAPNACWQLDVTGYVLTRGRKCVIYQLEDDHTRVAIASHVGWSENSEDALIVFKKGVAAYGVPQRLLTDNGVALNPHRRGWLSPLAAYAQSLGVETITGKPYKPTTQGKNERFHQTLFRYLNQQPLADSLEALQAQVDAFDRYYNNERTHQGLPNPHQHPPRLTPMQAWALTPVAEPPRPRPIMPDPIIPGVVEIALNGTDTPVQWKGFPETGSRTRTVNDYGTVSLNKINFQIGLAYKHQPVHAVWNTQGIIFVSTDGEIISEHPWPPPGTTYIGNGKPRGRKPEPSPKS